MSGLLPVTGGRVIDRAGIARAHSLIRDRIRRTPVVEVDGADFGLAGILPVAFKLEQLQHAGSFKARGAFTNLLSRTVPAAGVVAASGGNHGAAVAFACGRLNVPARIYVPSVASPAKMRQIRDYGAELIVCGDRYAESLAECREWATQHGALEIHAYDQVETMLGQGTLGLEWEDQSPHLDTVLVAVGGGGLIGGVAAWYGQGGKVRVIGVEPEAAPTLHMALEAGRPVDAPAGGIAADSLAPRRVGDLMFPIAQRHVERVVLVSDDSIRSAQQALWQALRLVAEPGGSAAFAGLHGGAYRPAPDERVGVLICGGNTNAVRFD